MRLSPAAFALCCSLASACAGQQARPAHPAPDADPEIAATSRHREQTWNEYYSGVHAIAFRHNATVIWVNPPQVRKPRPAVASAPRE